MASASESGNLAPPLSAVLLSAAAAVQAVDEGRSLTDALADTEPGLRPATQAVSFHAMRYMGWADTIANRLVPREPAPLAGALLRVSLALLKEPDQPGQTVPGMPVYAPHTVVDQAVTAAASNPRLAGFKGLINGSLRRFLRERDTFAAELANDPVVRWNHPQWWIKTLKQFYPQQWQTLLQAANVPAPLTLRINRRRASREQVIEAFTAAGIAARPTGEFGLVVLEPKPVTQLPGYSQGWWSVQDAGAQLAAPLLPLADGMRVLDACAAPGGKTAHMLEIAQLDLVALDNDSRRLERVGQNLERLGLHGAQLLTGDAANPRSWWDGRPFDAVLADVPCTASGIVRRHPDIRWLRRAPDVARTAALQARIADALWEVVAPGGHLLYVTCSIFPAEGQAQARAFAARHADAQALPSPGQLLPVAVNATPESQHDGFFYALFAKRP
ncbi:16S rRNA (cytosine(967)-C(5))-methyltransferase RsmB [Bordetella holmesii]|uniref:16S rRNA (Cytosine(967)-C(5))-methyltransferase n=2 Tax=Bordetella holmesii TaxID=35814 RepID=A0A158M4E6_9BORD|nr:16S rRNA (cytosine(967)-C(5))-methyltransferase RsmB [Bordetella holmesii]AHV93781.1 ribosomal RNA small subunit methyltransferase B [Bordetella holmesii ATCC 51541]AIT25830.1 ribosomal RNA small subunit methyltransferase B [Bordetella holmesii 44057]EWM42721.1 ribosomal RNA small subunit methyltransferase B [Bordetella holmesii 41130]EWM46398.1 ribosomal RNA small subunit methyltransferase B [Bordetella holmesii 35009]AMD47267.1 methyltransferase [Bordetella holmesii H558]